MESQQQRLQRKIDFAKKRAEEEKKRANPYTTREFAEGVFSAKHGMVITPDNKLVKVPPIASTPDGYATLLEGHRTYYGKNSRFV